MGALFLAQAALFAGIAVQAPGPARVPADPDRASTLRNRLSRLFLLLAVAGVWLCSILALMVRAILSRIGEGFAVFG